MENEELTDRILRIKNKDLQKLRKIPVMDDLLDFTDLGIHNNISSEILSSDINDKELSKKIEGNVRFFLKLKGTDMMLSQGGDYQKDPFVYANCYKGNVSTNRIYGETKKGWIISGEYPSITITLPVIEAKSLSMLEKKLKFISKIPFDNIGVCTKIMTDEEDYYKKVSEEGKFSISEFKDNHIFYLDIAPTKTFEIQNQWGFRQFLREMLITGRKLNEYAKLDTKKGCK